MNREEIIKLARKAGYEPKLGWELAFDLWDFDFERFADIVAAAEREACAKVADKYASIGGGFIADEIRARGEK